MTVVFSLSDHRVNWEKSFMEAKKNFMESCSRKPANFLSAIAIPRNRSGVHVSSCSFHFEISLDIMCFY